MARKEAEIDSGELSFSLNLGGEEREGSSRYSR
jgi:hypothetical protein